jgi:uncharacterized protein
LGLGATFFAMKHRKTFLGIGWKFPPTFDKRTRSVEMVSEYDDIIESLYILLSTKKGERIMLPDFGCNLTGLIFENINGNTLTNASQLIREAILYFEPRITVDDIDLDPDEVNGIINIKIIFTVRKTNTRSSMVYPYYLAEGSEIMD